MHLPPVDPLPTHVPRPGWAEQDPAAWMACIRRICAAGDRHFAAVGAALGLTSQVNAHVCVDTNGRVLLPAITWQDQRCTDAPAKLDQVSAAAFSYCI